MDGTESVAALHAALGGGVNFFDTADAYSDGRNERQLARDHHAPGRDGAIPGGKRASQVTDNVCAAALPALSDALRQAVQSVYAQFAKPWVHHAG